MADLCANLSILLLLNIKRFWKKL